uniref:Transposase IS30-like HTH domain-containing protein n=1 Tax=Meloidogyne javanica TaxID=6303 RepID=A0A915MN51_MELJA
MGRKSMLTDEEKGQIKAFKEFGLSNREIGRRLKRHHDVVARYLSLYHASRSTANWLQENNIATLKWP